MTTSHPCAATRELVAEITAALGPTVALAKLVDAALWLRSRSDLLQSRLRFLVSHPDRLAEIAQSAYWHVNGFAKVKLVERDEFSVRLHVWPAGRDRRGDTEPHSHRWDFASWIAVGAGLSENYFAECDSSEPGGRLHVRYAYGRRATGNGYLMPQGVVTSLLSDPPQERDTGTVYGCSHETIHTVAPVGHDLVATVVLQGRAVAESTAVYRPFGQLRFPHLEPPIDPDHLAGLFGAVDVAITTSDAR
jgi:hypothetical protein